MRVTLFRDMRAEGWRSMDRYADALVRELSIISSAREPRSEGNYQLSIFSLGPPVNFSKVRMFWRNEVYPRMAQFHQGEINHVLDHSYAHLLNWLDPKKTVVTCHDLLPLDFEQDTKIREDFLKKVKNLKRAAHILADSRDTKKDLIEKLEINPEKITVVYLGVDPTFRPVDSDEEKIRTRKKFNLPEGKIIFSHGQAHLPYKNLEGIIRAFAEVSKEIKGVYLLRVNQLTAAQSGLLKSLGVDDRYFEVFDPSDEELVELYNAADVFLSPSFKEGFGLPVLQSLACGLPVVISPGGSLEEIAGEVGVYVDPRSPADVTEKLIKVLSGQYPRREELVKRASEFTWGKTSRKTYEVYESVLRQKGLTL